MQTFLLIQLVLLIQAIIPLCVSNPFTENATPLRAIFRKNKGGGVILSFFKTPMAKKKKRLF